MRKLRHAMLLFIAVTVVTLVAVGLCGCALFGGDGKEPESEHEHTFSTEWAYVIGGHYHPSTCGHEVRGDFAPHELKDEMYEVNASGEFYECKVCGYVAAVSHDYTQPELLQKGELCTDKSRYRRTCKSCGYVDEYERAGEHEYGEWEIVSEELHSQTCNICGFESTHSPFVIDKEVLEAANCTHSGLQSGRCGICSLDVTVTVPALGHSYRYEFTDDAYHFRSCGRCGESGTVPHVFTEAEEEDGIFHYAECVDCESYIRLKHDFSDGECLCGLSYAPSDALSYAETDGGLKVVGIGSFTGTYLLIPSEHDGKSVVEIAANAFSGANSIKSVYVPDSVTQIGEGAFYGCNSVRSMRLPFIGAQKREATDLHQYPLGYIFGEHDANDYYGKWQSFYDDSLTQTTRKCFSIPSSLSYLSVGGGALLTGALGNCPLYDIILESGVTSIEYGSLPTGYQLHLSVSDTVTKIADGVLNDLDIKTMHVDEHNPRYGYIDKCFIDIMEKTVLKAFSGCRIPDDGTVTKLGARAFYNRSFQSLPTSYSLTVPTGITYIGEQCFEDANIIVEIESGKLTYIGDGAFSSCRRVSGFTIDTEDDVYIGDSAFGPGLSGRIDIKCASLIVGDKAFSGANLTSLNVECDTAQFGQYALRETKSLIWIDIESNDTVLAREFAYGSYVSSVMISGLSQFGQSSFEKCNEMWKLELSGELRDIPASAFANCLKLSAATLPGNLTSIGAYAFQNCRALKKMEIPDSVTSMGDCIFDGCSALAELKVPYLPNGRLGYLFSYQRFTGSYDVKIASSIWYVPNALKKVSVTHGNLIEAFNGFKSLTEIYLGEDGQYSGSLSSGCFDGVNITTLDIPDGMDIATRVPTFTGMANLKTVTWRLNTDSVGPYFSSDCSVETLTVADNVTSINTKAFYGMVKLTNVVVPDTVTAIGRYAFGGTALASLRLPFPLEETFGYLFSDTEVYGSSAVAQITSNGQKVFYIPIGLASVIVDGNIPDAAFMNCTYLKTVTCTGENIEIGDNAFKNSGITSFVQPGVTGIGTSAFEGCADITKIELGALTVIGDYAFKGCPKLSALVATLPGDLTAIPNGLFDGCAALTGFDVPSTVRIIGTRAFAGTGITAIALPELLTDISESAFDGCTKLYSIAVPANVDFIGDYAFRGCSGLAALTLPAAVSTLNAGLFSGCGALESIVIPSGVTSIGEGVFKNCVSLKSVYWNAADCTSVDGSCSIFENCTMLTDVFIGDSVIYIPDYAFYNCSEVESMTIPTNVSGIGSLAFKGCSKLVLYCRAQSVQSGWSAGWNDGCPVVFDCEHGDVDTDGYSYQYINGLRYRLKDAAEVYKQAAILSGDLIIPATVVFDNIRYDVTGIVGDAFRGCTALTGVTIGDNVTTIGKAAFDGCTALAGVTIGNGVTTVGANAFYGCVKLTSIIIPNGVESIGDCAFYGCVGITGMTVGGGVTTIGSSAFDGCANLQTLYWNVTSYISADDDNALFGSCNKLSNVFIGDNVTGIPDNAFHKWFTVGSGLNVTIGTGVTGIGENAFKGCTALTSVTVGAGVASIGNSAFDGCNKLTSITVPDGVKTIGDNAFKGCTALTSVTVGNGVESIGNSAFGGCNKLTSITVPDGVKTIGDYAFYGCTALTSVTIGNKVTSIGDYAFGGCNNITGIAVPDSVKTIGDNAFDGCTAIAELTIGNGVESIGNSAFNGCNKLTGITVPDSVTSIGSSAFKGCSGLTEIVIGNGVESIGNAAFSGCYVKTATIPAIACGYIKNSGLVSVTVTSGSSIDSGAFKDCTALTSVVLPDSVTDIGYDAFRNCDSLEGITLPNSVESIGSGAFYWCKKLASVNMPGRLKSIGGSAFYYCIALPSVNIPDSAESIGVQAFYGCIGLKYASIGNGVTTVAGSAFSGCTSLGYVTLGNSVAKIDMSAFSGCTGLSRVTMPETVAYIGSSAFYNCKALSTIYFGGTKLQWSRISRYDWNAGTGNYVVICKDGNLSKADS